MHSTALLDGSLNVSGHVMGTAPEVPFLPTAPGEGQAGAGRASGTSSLATSRPLPANPPFKVFIGNIPYDATAQEMGEVFHPDLQVHFVLRALPAAPAWQRGSCLNAAG